MDRGGYICIAMVWTRARRRGKPVRVIHLHWPRAGIVRCERAAKALREHLAKAS